MKLSSVPASAFLISAAVTLMPTDVASVSKPLNSANILQCVARASQNLKAGFAPAVLPAPKTDEESLQREFFPNRVILEAQNKKFPAGINFTVRDLDGASTAFVNAQLSIRTSPVHNLRDVTANAFAGDFVACMRNETLSSPQQNPALSYFNSVKPTDVRVRLMINP